MKKYILGIMVIMAVIFVSGCITDSNNNGDVQNPKTLAKNGILFKYPGTWTSANSGANDSIAAVADPSSKDSTTNFGKINVNIEKRTLSSPLNVYFNQTYTTLFKNTDYSLLAQGNTSTRSYQALECIYTENANGTIKQHKAVWFENNNEVYVILCTAPQSEFQNQNKNFEFILGSFKIT